MSNNHDDNSRKLGDFTTTARVVPLSLLAIGIGILSTIVAWALLRLIAFFTNIFYYGRLSTVLVSPAGNHLGWVALLIPVAGGLIIGFMARYGSERIRGHGIPEALESILINGSKVQPRLAVLKPISAAISIGSGGPSPRTSPSSLLRSPFLPPALRARPPHLRIASRRKRLPRAGQAGQASGAATLRSAGDRDRSAR